MYFLAFVAAVNLALIFLFDRDSAKGMVYFLYSTLAIICLTLLVGASGAISDVWLTGISAAFISSIIFAFVAFIAAMAFQWNHLYFNSTLVATVVVLLASLACYGGLPAVIGSVVGMVVLVVLVWADEKLTC